VTNSLSFKKVYPTPPLQPSPSYGSPYGHQSPYHPGQANPYFNHYTPEQVQAMYQQYNSSFFSYAPQQTDFGQSYNFSYQHHNYPDKSSTTTNSDSQNNISSINPFADVV
jgi:hypothetical protein